MEPTRTHEEVKIDVVARKRFFAKATRQTKSKILVADCSIGFVGACVRSLARLPIQYETSQNVGSIRCALTKYRCNAMRQRESRSMSQQIFSQLDERIEHQL
jgi:hypothetical protein